MTVKLLLALVVTAALGAPVGYVFYQGSLSPDNWIYQGGSSSNWKDGGLHGVPGPIAAESKTAEVCANWTPYSRNAGPRSVAETATHLALAFANLHYALSKGASFDIC